MKRLSIRQQKIIEMINQSKSLTIEQIQKAIGISQATAYRETQTLIKLDLVAKIPGGISRLELSTSLCIQCGREISPRTAFIFEQKDGTRNSACCAHCGLMALSHRTDINTAMTTDFFYGTILNARQTWYVLDSEVSLCCRPSVLSFSNKKDADRFVSGFGGSVMDFVTVHKAIDKKMEF